MYLDSSANMESRELFSSLSSLRRQPLATLVSAIRVVMSCRSENRKRYRVTPISSTLVTPGIVRNSYMGGAEIKEMMSELGSM